LNCAPGCFVVVASGIICLTSKNRIWEAWKINSKRLCNPCELNLHHTTS